MAQMNLGKDSGFGQKPCQVKNCFFILYLIKHHGWYMVVAKRMLIDHKSNMNRKMYSY